MIDLARGWLADLFAPWVQALHLEPVTVATGLSSALPTDSRQRPEKKSFSGRCCSRLRDDYIKSQFAESYIKRARWKR